MMQEATWTVPVRSARKRGMLRALGVVFRRWLRRRLREQSPVVDRLGTARDRAGFGPIVPR